MRLRRPAAILSAAAVLLAGLVFSRTEAVVTQSAPYRGSTGRHPALKPASTPGTRPLFGGYLLTYANDPLTPAQVRAVAAATRGSVVPVSTYEDYLASGLPSYPGIPVLVMVADPRSYATAAGEPAGLAAQMARGAVLAKTEAQLRHVGAGGMLRFEDGRRIRVTAVVDDHVLGGNEMALPAARSHRPGAGADYLLVADGGDSGGTDSRIRHALAGTSVRVETTTANGYLSSADRVLTQLQVKALFGEFAIHRTGATSFDQDPAWISRHLVTTTIPQLGPVTCNRGVVPALTAAMTEITRRGLGATVHTADFQYEGGCWNPNIIPGPEGTISRHSWGIAADINVDTNTFGQAPRQDPRLVAVMAAHGFTWGGRWLTPDGMHFEFATVPVARSR